MTDQPPTVTIVDPDGNPVTVGGATKTELLARIAELRAEWAERTGKSNFLNNVHTLTATARDKNWDWIDAYCHTEVASIPYVSGQSPNAGQSWGAPTAAQAADRLRLGMSWLMLENIRISQALDMILDVLAGLIERDPDLVPPADR